MVLALQELLAKLLLWSPNSITALGAVVGLQNVELLAALQALVAIPRVLHQVGDQARCQVSTLVHQNTQTRSVRWRKR